MTRPINEYWSWFFYDNSINMLGSLEDTALFPVHKDITAPFYIFRPPLAEITENQKIFPSLREQKSRIESHFIREPQFPELLTKDLSHPANCGNPFPLIRNHLSNSAQELSSADRLQVYGLHVSSKKTVEKKPPSQIPRNLQSSPPRAFTSDRLNPLMTDLESLSNPSTMAPFENTLLKTCASINSYLWRRVPLDANEPIKIPLADFTSLRSQFYIRRHLRLLPEPRKVEPSTSITTIPSTPTPASIYFGTPQPEIPPPIPPVLQTLTPGEAFAAELNQKRAERKSSLASLLKQSTSSSPSPARTERWSGSPRCTTRQISSRTAIPGSARL